MRGSLVPRETAPNDVITTSFGLYHLAARASFNRVAALAFFFPVALLSGGELLYCVSS